MVLILMGLLFLVNLFLSHTKSNINYFYVNMGNDQWIEFEINNSAGGSINSSDILSAISTMLISVEDMLYSSSNKKYSHLNVVKHIKIILPTILKKHEEGAQYELQHI